MRPRGAAQEGGWLPRALLDGSNRDVYAQRYSSDGNAIGSEFRVNTQTADQQEDPVIAMDADGNFVVSWVSCLARTGEVCDLQAISGQMFDRNGNPIGAEFYVDTAASEGVRSPSIAMNANGNFVVTWISRSQDGNLF